MNERARTIQFFLPNGNPRGVRIAEFTSRTMQVIQVPRAQLGKALERSELANVGLYLLVGESDSGQPLAYVGESEDCAARLRQHNAKLDWWNTALVCVSRTQDFTKAHVKYLEWYAYQEIAGIGRYRLENSTVPTKSYVPEPVVADLMDHFDTLAILVASLGHPFFDRVQADSPQERLVCKGKKAQTFGLYTEEGMVVLAGGIANKEPANSMHAYLRVVTDQLLSEGVLEVVDEQTLRFTKDHVFPSPSQAAALVLARNANGWIEWKYPDGRTLDEVRRKA